MNSQVKGKARPGSATAARSPALVGLAIGVALAAVVTIRALLASDGYLSPDSMNYLALAQNLDLGHGFRTLNDGRAPAGFEPFATWPVGYPLLIHLLSTFTGLGPYLASKALNAVTLGLSAAVVAGAAGRNGPILALTFASGTAIEIFSYTWSEVPFIFLLVFAAVLLAGSVEGEARHRTVRSVLLAACCFGLFLCRYVGAFAVALIAVAALVYIWRRALWPALLNAILLVLVLTAIWFYLRHNTAVTGYATGMQRVPPTESAAARTAMLAGALISQTVLPTAEFDPSEVAHWLAVLCESIGLTWLVIVIRRHYPHPLRVLRVDSLGLCLLLVGGLYLGAIITLRWLNEFDPYNFRLLGPGTLLVIMALLRLTLLSWPAATRATATLMCVLAVLSGSIALSANLSARGGGYFSTVRTVRQRYAGLPSGAIVVFGNEHLRYLRPDLFISMPLCRPWFLQDESWAEYAGEIDWSHPVYLDMSGDALHGDGCQASVRSVLSVHHVGDLVRLRPPTQAGGTLRSHQIQLRPE